VHYKLITGPSPSDEKNTNISVGITIIPELATETVDHLQVHELDYWNPSIKAAQKRYYGPV